MKHTLKLTFSLLALLIVSIVVGIGQTNWSYSDKFIAWEETNRAAMEI